MNNLFNQKLLVQKAQEEINLNDYSEKRKILNNWINSLEKGILSKSKEEEFQGEFLNDIFSLILGAVNKSSKLNGFGVDAGLASFCDASVAEEYTKFYSNNDYFIKLLQGKQFIDWEIPGTNHKIAMFETGFGDGYYMSLYGLNEKDEVCELVIPFINPEIID